MMEVGELETLINNEIEWRKTMYKDLHEMKDDVTDLKVGMGKLKVKSTIWGLLGGIIPASIVLVFMIVKQIGG